MHRSDRIEMPYNGYMASLYACIPTNKYSTILDFKGDLRGIALRKVSYRSDECFLKINYFQKLDASPISIMYSYYTQTKRKFINDSKKFM